MCIASLSTKNLLGQQNDKKLLTKKENTKNHIITRSPKSKANLVLCIIVFSSYCLSHITWDKSSAARCDISTSITHSKQIKTAFSSAILLLDLQLRDICCESLSQDTCASMPLPSLSANSQCQTVNQCTF